MALDQQNRGMVRLGIRPPGRSPTTRRSRCPLRTRAVCSRG